MLKLLSGYRKCMWSLDSVSSQQAKAAHRLMLVLEDWKLQIMKARRPKLRNPSSEAFRLFTFSSNALDAVVRGRCGVPKMIRGMLCSDCASLNRHFCSTCFSQGSFNGASDMDFDAEATARPEPYRARVVPSAGS